MGPAHPGSPPPRKRLMLANQGQGQVTGVNDAASTSVRQQGTLDVLEHSPSKLGRARRHHSDPGACVLKLQRPSSIPGFIAAPAPSGSIAVAIPIPNDGQHSSGIGGKPSSKRERTSSGGAPIGTSTGASSPPSFTITVDCRGDNAATALWHRMHLLEIRNKELEQQLVERMQAAHISSSSSSRAGQQHAALARAQTQMDRDTAGSSPRSHAQLETTEGPVAMEVEPSCSSAAALATQQPSPPLGPGPPAEQQQKQAPLGLHLQQLQQQQQDDSLQQGSQRQQQRQQQQRQPLQEIDGGSPQLLVCSLRSQVQNLQRELQRQKQLSKMLQSDNADLEAVLKETERQRREFAARYAFMTLDTDGDGYVSVEQVLTYDLFSCYAPSVLMAAFSVWRWDSGFPGYLCMDDFVRFVEYAEDRSTRESQRFWFSVMDADGDGRLSWADMKLLYDAVEKSCNAGILLHFEDLMNQIRDMVSQQRNPADGFTAQELWDSKLGAGVIGLLTNANNMLLQRSTAEWGRGDFPL